MMSRMSSMSSHYKCVCWTGDPHHVHQQLCSETQTSLALHCVLDVFVAAKSEQLRSGSQEAIVTIVKIVCLHRPSTLHHLRLFGIRKISKGLDQRKQWKSSEWSGHHMASIKHRPLLEDNWDPFGNRLLSRINNNYIRKSQKRLLDERNYFVHICSCVP